LHGIGEIARRMASLEFASRGDGLTREIASKDFTEAVGTSFLCGVSTFYR
jgi:hypothetical protein